MDFGGVFKTGVFNIADMSVTTGMILLLISSFINRPSKKLDNPH
jgi:signal peptidase II